MRRSADTTLRGSELTEYLAEVRAEVLEEIDRIIPRGTRYDRDLYDPMRAYPFREAKGLRPALCVAVCRALGGRKEAVLPSAAVLELYHNAFLVHDDVEDGSWMRRGGPTLHRELGMSAAINVGDGMLALCLKPLLENTHLIGLGPALHILQAVAEMSEQTVEGQALELGWIRRKEYGQTDRDYLRMVHQKTTWYTFTTPIRIGTIVGSARAEIASRLRLWGTLLGSAFQIQDDVLNLRASETEYGKEADGDLWEGKRTLILGHCLRTASPRLRARAIAILDKRRPLPDEPTSVDTKTAAEVAEVRALIDRFGSLDYADAVAARRVGRASTLLERLRDPLGESVHFDFLMGLTKYVQERGR